MGTTEIGRFRHERYDVDELAAFGLVAIWLDGGTATWLITNDTDRVRAARIEQRARELIARYTPTEADHGPD